MKKLLSVILLFSGLQLFAQQKITHQSTVANSSANSTYIDAAGLNNNPNAIIIVEYDASTAKANPHAVGVWYNGNKWAIFNQDRAAMPAGLTFSITWYNPGENNFFQKVSSNNVQNGALLIDHPRLNNNPEANFYASQVWNPGGIGGVYNNADIALQYDKSAGKWAIRNTNGTPLPDGASFNIAVIAKAFNPAAKIDPAVNKTPVTTSPRPGINNEVISNAGANIDQTVLDAAKSSSANLGFEELFLNWKASGTAFANQPVSGNVVMSERVTTRMNYAAGGLGGDYWKSMPYPIGFKGNNWIGTYENGNGDAPVGTLTSRAFRAEKKFLCFLLGGGKDFNNLYVELQVKKEDYEAAWGRAKRGVWGETEDGFYRVSRLASLLNSEELYRYYFDLGAELNNQFAGKLIRIQLTDNKSGNWGHINADDFIFRDNLNDFIYFMKDGFGVYADKDKPVWGFSDTHAHWVNHIGLKGLMHGTPGGKLETSDVRRDVPPCDEFNHGLPSLTPGMLVAQTEKAAWNRIPERLADPGNATCMTLSGIIALPTAVDPAGMGALLGSIGQYAGGAQIATGALDGLITGAVWSMVLNPAFQACGYQFTKDVFAKHYGNRTPADKPSVSNYVDFPKWNTFFHQLMHISWVRRSYDGGQRLMVVPVGVAKSWEFNTTSDGVMSSAKRNIENAVTELKRIVNENPGWLAIATTPKQAREIILSNKMAIIIAIEQAEVGTFFESAQDEVNWLESLGIRHVFPIHNINNKLGGAAVFNSKLNSYNDLVNRTSNDGPIQAFHVREGNTGGDSRTTVKLARDFMRQNLRTFPVIGFGTMPFFYFNDVPADYHYDDFTFHKNSEGLTLKGREYILALMRKGMIIEVDHMSDLSQDYAMGMFRRNNYPMISGHTNYRDLRRENNATDGGDKEARLKTEFTIYNSRATEINDAGGMFGLMTQQNNVESATGCPVPNNAAGGSSSFAQAYWYTLQKTGGNKGIAFGSDFNGFAPQIAPRFGVDAAFMLEGDNILNASTGPRGEDKMRRVQAFAQEKGVRYDSPIKTYHYHRFLKPPFLTSEEREIWEAIAIAKSGTAPTAAWQPGGGLSVERTGLQQDKVKNMAEGFRWGILHEPTGDYGAFLECPEYIVRDENLNNCMPERKAAYMAVRGETSLPEHMRSSRTIELYRVMKPIYDLWMQFENGPNEPLRRSYAYAGGRDFDFNLDGLAHYGMFPDLIQDLKNNGFSPEQIKPLFLSAEQYIKMWEQADAAKTSVRD